VEAKRDGRPSITAWGTGNATREFLHAADCAEGIVRAAELYDRPDPVNLGSGSEISIRELVALVARLTGFEGDVVWDASQPDGQPRRRLDTSRAAQAFGFRARIGLDEGLRQSVEFFLKQEQIPLRP